MSDFWKDLGPVNYHDAMISGGHKKYSVRSRYADGSVSEETTDFPVEDWSVHITFTPKPRPFIPGYYRRTVTGMDSSKNVAYWYPTDPTKDDPRWERVDVTPA